jgi:hypothetical protein
MKINSFIKTNTFSLNINSINMKMPVTIISFAFITIYMSSCNHSPSANKETTSYQSGSDTELVEFISKIKAVDNHAHPNTIDPDDKSNRTRVRRNRR